MNFKIIIISFCFAITAKEMNHREKEIVSFMKLPASSLNLQLPGDLSDFDNLTESDIKQGYLLSVVGWNALGSADFIKKMSDYVESFEEFLQFRQFMADKVPHNPPPLFTHNNDCSACLVKCFHSEMYQYVMSEYSYLPGVIIIEERNTGAILTLRKEVVYPKILFGES